jgi:hypothetical protein
MSRFSWKQFESPLDIGSIPTESLLWKEEEEEKNSL